MPGYAILPALLHRNLGFTKAIAKGYTGHANPVVMVISISISHTSFYASVQFLAGANYFIAIRATHRARCKHLALRVGKLSEQHAQKSGAEQPESISP
jgi:hypothetical protein